MYQAMTIQHQSGDTTIHCKANTSGMS